jgi:UDP-N-acetylmuramoylalanine--D-glutamate ligase
VVLNADDPWVAAMRAGLPARGAGAATAAGMAGSVAPAVVTFSIQREDADYALHASAAGLQLARRGVPLLPVERIKMSGLHNAANALAALALGDAAGLPLPAMIQALETFAGLPHRSEWVADVGGVRFVDDSKGTNVGATLAAVSGLPGPLVLIAGGLAKGQDFTPLGPALAGKARHVVLIGRDAPEVGRALEGICTLEQAASLEEAVAAAARAARPGDTVLLSPACASLDMFRDYHHRGEVFAAAVRALPGAKASTP